MRGMELNEICDVLMILGARGGKFPVDFQNLSGNFPLKLWPWNLGNFALLQKHMGAHHFQLMEMIYCRFDKSVGIEDVLTNEVTPFRQCSLAFRR